MVIYMSKTESGIEEWAGFERGMGCEISSKMSRGIGKIGGRMGGEWVVKWVGIGLCTFFSFPFFFSFFDAQLTR
jgi:hypothetical protein